MSVNFWKIWVLDFLQTPLPYSHLPPGETTDTQQQLKEGLNNCSSPAELWSLTVHVGHPLPSRCGLYLDPYVKTNSICLPSATSFHSDTSNCAPGFLPLQGEPLSSVSAATEPIKAYCVQLLPSVGGKLRHRRTHFLQGHTVNLLQSRNRNQCFSFPAQALTIITSERWNLAPILEVGEVQDPESILGFCIPLQRVTLNRSDFDACASGVTGHA